MKICDRTKASLKAAFPDEQLDADDQARYPMSLSKAASELLERIVKSGASIGRSHKNTRWQMVCGTEIGDATDATDELIAAGLVSMSSNKFWIVANEATVAYAAREARIRDEAGAMYALFPWLVDMFAAYVEDVSGREIDTSHPDYERLTKAREIVRRIEGQ